MSLKLTPATKDWDQPTSAEQSPVEPATYQDVYHMSVSISTKVEEFIQAAAAFLREPAQSDSASFIRRWKESFEECLSEFKEIGDGSERDSDGAGRDCDASSSDMETASPPGQF
jgi:hypothetical protein